MSTRQNGYVCYAFTCDHDDCGAETLMSAADQLSAALHLSERGWGFDLRPGGGSALTFCPQHEMARAAAVVPLVSSP